jgi:hypothetical protein
MLTSRLLMSGVPYIRVLLRTIMISFLGPNIFICSRMLFFEDRWCCDSSRLLEAMRFDLQFFAGCGCCGTVQL